MLIFYRSIPALAGLLTAAAFWAVIGNPKWFLSAMGILLAALAFLYARLVDLPKRDFGFWNFFLTPLLLVLAGAAFFAFLEMPIAMVVLLGVVSTLQLAYAEHLFYYFHRPSEYRVYTIERISFILSMVVVFLLSSALFGLLILVNVPLWALAPAFFLVAVFLVYTLLWVSKVDPVRASPYAVAGGLLLTQIFIALSFLPVGHMTSGAFLTACFYFFLGVSRADFMGRLTRPVFLRYLFFTLLMLVLILSTTKWV